MIYISKPDKITLYINASKKTSAQVKAETGCTAIINGGLYNMSTFKPVCHLKADGKVLSADQYKYWGYAWNDSDINMVSDYAAYKNYICCVTMVRNGQAYAMNYNSDMGGSRPRTAIGLFPDGRIWLYCDQTNKTPEQMQKIALDTGLDSAVMLDGGGSTQGIFPNGKVESSRIVQNYICVFSDIIEETYDWAYELTPRKATDYIILHHAAASSASAQDIHKYHRFTNGWNGIAYHFYIRKDGSVYRGRPENTIGGHTLNYNDTSIGVCFEGDYQTETMPDAQLAAGQNLVDYLKKTYPDAKIGKHSDYNSTSCPGKNFPFDKMIKKTIYRVQVGAFTIKENAEKLAAQLRSSGYSTIIREE